MQKFNLIAHTLVTSLLQSIPLTGQLVRGNIYYDGSYSFCRWYRRTQSHRSDSSMQRKWTQISTITGITPYLRVLDLESLLIAEPSSAKDWIYPLKEVLFVSSELPN